MVEISYYLHINLYWELFNKFKQNIFDYDDLCTELKSKIKSMTESEIIHFMKDFKNFYFQLKSQIDSVNKEIKWVVIWYFIVHSLGFVIRITIVYHICSDIFKNRNENTTLIYNLLAYFIWTTLDFISFLYSFCLTYDVCNFPNRAKLLFSRIYFENLENLTDQTDTMVIICNICCYRINDKVYIY